jgi:hypothetical protein
MSLQFINDNKGNTSGVFIPIADWERLKQQYSGLRSEEQKSGQTLPAWQRQLLDDRLAEHVADPKGTRDFLQLLDSLASER